MVALITSDSQIPNNIAQGIFKKAQTGSVIARLSGARPQKFGTETNWALTAAPKAEIVGEGAQKWSMVSASWVLNAFAKIVKAAG